MTLSQSASKLLLDLIEEKELNGSRFHANKILLKQLEDERIVTIKALSRTRRRVILVDKLALEKFIADEYEIYNLKQLQQLRNDDTVTRTQLTQICADSKIITNKPMEGMYISSYDGIELEIDNTSIILNLPPKSALFVHEHATISIDKGILVIGIENFDNLKYAADQTHLFDNNRQKIFVQRNQSMIKWLSVIENEYLHFGDFDLAGISIYLNEIVPKLLTNKHTFYIPKEIEFLLKMGSRERYFLQYPQYKNIKSNNPELQKLINIIHDKKRGLEQEYLILNKQV